MLWRFPFVNKDSGVFAEGVFDAWRNVVPERIRHNVKPKEYGDGVLTVIVETKAWSCAMHLEREQILTSMRDRLRSDLPNDLRIMWFEGDKPS